MSPAEYNNNGNKKKCNSRPGYDSTSLLLQWPLSRTKETTNVDKDGGGKGILIHCW
jgi:hypothetical protein